MGKLGFVDLLIVNIDNIELNGCYILFINDLSHMLNIYIVPFANPATNILFAFYIALTCAPHAIPC